MADEPGALPWLVGIKKNNTRQGPQFVPLPGVASIFVSLGQTVAFNLCPIQGILDAGIAAPDYETFLGTKTGEKYMETEDGQMGSP